MLNLINYSEITALFDQIRYHLSIFNILMHASKTVSLILYNKISNQQTKISPHFCHLIWLTSISLANWLNWPHLDFIGCPNDVNLEWVIPIFWWVRWQVDVFSLDLPNYLILRFVVGNLSILIVGLNVSIRYVIQFFIVVLC